MSCISDEVSYDPNSGKFFWIKPKNGRKVGAEAGSVNTTGYRIICVNRKRYLAHRLAWFLHYGEWPRSDLDHMNGVKDDNRIDNLRECSKSQNQMNRKAKGYSYHKASKKWQARIGHGNKETYLGWFDSESDAKQAYEDAKMEYHKEFSYKEE